MSRRRCCNKPSSSSSSSTGCFCGVTLPLGGVYAKLVISGFPSRITYTSSTKFRNTCGGAFVSSYGYQKLIVRGLDQFNGEFLFRLLPGETCDDAPVFMPPTELDERGYPLPETYFDPVLYHYTNNADIVLCEEVFPSGIATTGLYGGGNLSLKDSNWTGRNNINPFNPDCYSGAAWADWSTDDTFDLDVPKTDTPIPIRVQRSYVVS